MNPKRHRLNAPIFSSGKHFFFQKSVSKRKGENLKATQNHSIPATYVETPWKVHEKTVLSIFCGIPRTGCWRWCGCHPGVQKYTLAASPKIWIRFVRQRFDPTLETKYSSRPVKAQQKSIRCENKLIETNSTVLLNTMREKNSCQVFFSGNAQTTRTRGFVLSYTRPCHSYNWLLKEKPFLG